MMRREQIKKYPSLTLGTINKKADKDWGSSPRSLRQPSHHIVSNHAYRRVSPNRLGGLLGFRQLRSVGFASPAFTGFTFIG